MYVERYGTGPDIYLAVHGWGGDHREFAPLAARLPASATLHSVDLPGYGKSPRLPGMTLSSVADQIVEYAAGLGAPVTLIGFCSGVVTVGMTALADPSRCKRMVLIEPFTCVPWYFRVFTLGRFGRRAYRSTFESAVGRRITNWVLRKKQTPDADFMEAFTRVDHETTWQYLQWYAQFGSMEPFRILSMPVDIAFGERTFQAVRKSSGMLCDILPQTQVHTLRNIGHLPMIKGARQLADLVFGGSGGAGAAT